ncbi:4-hydroxy-3-methylbut-2-enyl diphosphate reductase [candidate division WOR-3 bacterium]|nr:4-hydroxy-3-methylbut-2-enyl diphosphate reductase [candidate division WOR-3 bacterium]
MKKKVIIAEHYGFCSGVEIAVNTLNKLMDKKKNIYIYGDLIHNRIVMDKFKNRGLHIINNIDDIPDNGTLVIRTHGVKPMVYKKAKEKGLDIIDLTCVYVKRSQKYAKEIIEKGLNLIIIGEKGHDEILSIQGASSGAAIVINSKKEAERINTIQKAGIVIQTTFNRETAKDIISILFDKIGYLVVYNTICNATEKRQNACKNLAIKTDAIVVVGDKMSSNTNRLYEIAKYLNINTFMVNDETEIDCKKYKNYKSVGITAGASTPDIIIKQVIKMIENC